MRYEDLVADPVGTVEAIYGHFGLPLTGAAADAIRSLAASRAEGDAPHRYALEEFALTGGQVDERFSGGSAGPAWHSL